MFLTVFEDTGMSKYVRECERACVRALSTTVRVDVTLSPIRSSSECSCHVVFHAGLDLGSNLLPSVIQ